MYGSNPIETGNFDTEKTLKIIESTLKKCVNVLPPPKPINVFVFRSFNRFILEKLYGSSGFAPMKNFLFLYIVPSSDLSAFLPMTVAHEYNHAVRFNYAEWINLSDSLISEGLAQKFAEHIAGGHELMARVLTEKRALDIFKKLTSKQLSSRGSEIYNKLFFEDKEYPLWAGYSIGYHLVNLFLKANKKFTWKDITKVKSKD
ncbi:MAG: DUF2268 domain-containing protein, partial [Patescibacteria group bacterium]|nr:DUF2268 domain-containing protein [Patescibacteria group bacterium]